MVQPLKKVIIQLHFFAPAPDSFFWLKISENIFIHRVCSVIGKSVIRNIGPCVEYFGVFDSIGLWLKTPDLSN